MAEINFFMNYEDNISFIRFLFENFQPVFIEDNVIDQPPQPRQSFDSVSDLVQSRDMFPRFFVTSPLWTIRPLSISSVNAVDGKVHWYVDQRYGGPAFDFIPSRKVSNNGQTWIVPGSFNDYPWYYVKKNSPKTFDRPTSMQKAFKKSKNIYEVFRLDLFVASYKRVVTGSQEVLRVSMLKVHG